MPLDQKFVDHPEVTEALTKKYDQGVVVLVPLASGHMAVFGRDLELHEIVEGTLDVDDIRSLSTAIASRIHNNAIFGQEAKFYGEPDDKTWKRDQIKAKKLAAKPEPVEEEVFEPIEITL